MLKSEAHRGVNHSSACSVAEVEVVVGVGVVLALTQEGANEVEGASWEDNAHPHLQAVVDDDTVDEEALEAAVEEVEHPLLSRVGAMVEDVATRVGRLLVVVLLTFPSTVLHLGHAQAFAVAQTNVLQVALLVVRKSASYTAVLYS